MTRISQGARWIFIWLWVFSISCMVWLLGRAYAELGTLNAFYLLGCLLVVLVAESAFVLLLHRLACKVSFSRPWAAWILIVAILGVLLINQRYFLLPVLDASWPYKALGLTMLGVVSLVALANDRFQKYLLLLAILFGVIPWFSEGGGHRHRVFAVPPQVTNPTLFQNSRRNVYLLSFDSLVSKASLTEIFGNPVLPWAEPLREMGFRVFENAVAAGKNTMESFSNILHMQEMPAPLPNISWAEMFGGAYPNPGYSLFKSNGYKIQFLYRSSYFGYKSGPWLDYFYPPRSIGVCDFLSPAYGIFACRESTKSIAAKYLGLPMVKEQDQVMERVLTERIATIASDTKPWLTIAYFFSPGHPLGEYHYNDIGTRQQYMKQFFVESSSAIEIMQRTVAQIRKQDSSAIILVFGDHGAGVMAGLKSKNMDTKLTELIHLDQTGVTFAVFPQDFCASYFKERYDLKNLLRHTTRCLGNSKPQ